MYRSIIILLGILLAVEASAQQASLEWTRCVAEGSLLTTIHASKKTQRIVGCTDGAVWQTWGVSNRALPNRIESVLDRGHAYCSVLCNSDSVLISGGDGIWAWNVYSGAFTQILKTSSLQIREIDASADGNLIAYFGDDFSLHLFDRNLMKE